MSDSPYALVGVRYVERGYSSIPIVPGEKRPGDFRRGEWVGAFNWERFCDRLPSHFETDIWTGWPDAGVCVALGKASNLIAIDFDYGSPEVRAALERVLPPSPVRKTGLKGYTSFYRFNGLPSRKFLVNGQSVIEVLSHGKQTVLPPTIHPEGMPYRWLTTDTLEDMSAADLPELPDDLIARIEQALAPYQSEQDTSVTKLRDLQNVEGSYWRDINDRAMADFNAWVPELFPMAKPSAQGNWRVIAYWRNCEKPNVSIHAEGITDWGLGENMTPIDLVMRACGADLDTAVDWLKTRVGISRLDAVIDLDAMRRAAEARSAQAMAEVRAAASAERAAASVEAALPPPVHPPAPPPAAGYFGATGAVGMLIDYINKTSIYPQPILATGAALCAMGALMGRRYASPTDLRTNLYAVGIADSGSGKNHPRVIINRVFTAAGQQAFLGGNKIASGSGFTTATTRHPATLFLQDEFGMFLAAAADRKRSPHHLTEILDLMTEFYTTSNDVFRGSEYADQRQRPRRDIYAPNVCIYGTTNPHSFWNSLQSSNAVDGTLARFLIFVTEDDYPDAQDDVLAGPPSDDLVDMCRRLATHGNGNLTAAIAGDVPPPPPMVVPYSADAADVVKVFWKETRARLRSVKGTQYTAVLSRVFEMTMKVALIHAVGRNPEQPEIDVGDVNWARLIVDRSTETMLSGIERFVADNAVEAYLKRTLEIIRSAGEEGIQKTTLSQRTQFLSARDRDSVIKSLLESEQVIASIVISGKGRPLTIYRVAST